MELLRDEYELFRLPPMMLFLDDDTPDPLPGEGPYDGDE
jgi:hypothetical protein